MEQPEKRLAGQPEDSASTPVESNVSEDGEVCQGYAQKSPQRVRAMLSAAGCVKPSLRKPNQVSLDNAGHPSCSSIVMPP